MTAHYALGDHILKNNGIDSQEERDGIQTKTLGVVGLAVAAFAIATAVLTTDLGATPVEPTESTAPETVLVVNDAGM